MAKRSKIIYANDATESIGFLIRLRLPWLIVGIIISVLTALVVSKFEHVLSSEVRLAFFIPVIVYISDAVGTQTETIFVRNLNNSRKFSLYKYLVKELSVGMIMGVLFGAAVGMIAYVWLGSVEVALTVGLALLISVTCATVVAMLLPALLSRERQDPALGAGPVTTVIQDLLSLMIYFIIATAIIFR